MAVLSSSLLLLLLLLLISLTDIVDSRPPALRDNGQVLEGLFGSHLSSLILAPPSPRDVSEGSGDIPSTSSQANSRLVRIQEAARGLAGQQEVVLPQFFLDFLQRQRRFRGRTRKAAARGCFGMKMDRIGSISGLGC